MPFAIMYPFPDGGWVGGPRLPLHTEQYLLSHIDCLAEGVLSQEGKASSSEALLPNGGSFCFLHKAYPSCSAPRRVLYSEHSPWGSLLMSASWMAGDWALCPQALVQAGVSLMSQSQEQGSDPMKLFLVTSSKINKQTNPSIPGEGFGKPSR